MLINVFLSLFLWLCLYLQQTYKITKNLSLTHLTTFAANVSITVLMKYLSFYLTIQTSYFA